MEFIFRIKDLLGYKLILSILIFIGSYLAVIWGTRLVNKQIDNLKRRHQVRRSIYYITFILNIIIILVIWIRRTVNLTTYLGFLSAGVTLALHQVLLNIAAWILMVVKRPFSLGDRIEWGQIQGDVIDIGVFYTTMLEVGNRIEAEQSTGRLVQMPNSNLFKKSIFNYTKGFGCFWNETQVLVTFESDWEQAQEIMLNIINEEKEEGIEERAKCRVQKMSRNYMIKYGAFTPTSYVKIKDSGVQITLRYLTSVRKRRVIEDRVYKRILEEFKQELDIELAYPTKRIYRKVQKRKEDQLCGEEI
ncbi:mechanosensitive ion channel [Halanaerocella petrolearia]